jgi:hypothetical protein
MLGEDIGDDGAPARAKRTEQQSTASKTPSRDSSSRLGPAPRRGTDLRSLKIIRSHLKETALPGRSAREFPGSVGRLTTNSMHERAQW